jgi:hypothetical protein
MNAQPPGAAYIAWAQSMPALRCFGAAMRPWTNASAKSNVAITKTDRFGDTELKQPLGMTTIPAKGSQNYYAAARLPNHGAVIHTGSESEESSFTAIIASAPAPPHTIALLTAPVSAGAGLGLGSTRSAVEHVLGHATVTTARSRDLRSRDMVHLPRREGRGDRPLRGRLRRRQRFIARAFRV